MDWYIIARCNICNDEKVLEVVGDLPPYELGDLIEDCPCGGKYVVEEIREIDQENDLI